MAKMKSNSNRWQAPLETHSLLYMVAALDRKLHHHYGMHADRDAQ